MPKATLEFDTTEDRCEFRIAVHAMDWALVALDMDNYLREQINRHGSDLQAVRNELHGIMDDKGVHFGMIE